jgi:hypothetical protein
MYAQCSLWIVLTSLLWAWACTSDDGGGRFRVLGEAVTRDAQTGLEWTRRDDGAGLDWHKAEAYCRSLSVDDAGGWRLPTIDELRSLYGASPKVPCGDAMCAIDPVFTLSSPYVWSATEFGVSARTYLDFKFGTQLSPTITPRLVRGVLCVRPSATPAGGD